VWVGVLGVWFAVNAGEEGVSNDDA